MPDKKIIIAGGGTGGHIFPAIAIANALRQKEPDIDILFVGAKGKMEMEKVPEAGYRIEGLDIAGFNRSSLFKNISLPFKLVKSFLQVRKIIADFKPDAVIGVGGYSSFPVLRYAQKRGIPSFIHESNSLAGKSNKLLGKEAVRIFTATGGMEKYFPEEKIMVTGNPVRSAIAQAQVTREEGIRFFGLNPEKITVLIVGGSLGAKSINEAIEQGAEKIVSRGLQLIWQTGKYVSRRPAELMEEYKEIWAGPFISRMDCAYQAADLVVSRAGAMAIAELSVMKKPVIFVPYPFAAEDHQTVNAKHLVDKNAALLIRDSEAPARLTDSVIHLAGDAGKREELKNNIAGLAVTSADERIAEAVLEEIDDAGKNIKEQKVKEA